eukprot:CAMPEP_0182491274 /NCGR_PEP_ID=MMETSP1321-20130603/798_2 /TAXON_ID=91990 /ORGANISM="Bolidomonas sp., Strain RCC1657" /LENGTH=106 /DNA_ID=CAMNT_0024693545 /DNA_START=157 /DNA_END=474 /DNA_ORIENTATION=-
MRSTRCADEGVDSLFSIDDLLDLSTVEHDCDDVAFMSPSCLTVRYGAVRCGTVFIVLSHLHVPPTSSSALLQHLASLRIKRYLHLHELHLPSSFSSALLQHQASLR